MRDKKRILRAAALAALLAAFAGAAFAGTDNSEFEEIWDLLESWSTGTFGKVIALTALIVGVSFGVVRQSVVAVVVAFSIAIVLSYGPRTIEGIFTATGNERVAETLERLDNGLRDEGQESFRKGSD